MAAHPGPSTCNVEHSFVERSSRGTGTIEAGKRADLIVVDGDPLADISAIRKVSMVIAAGTAYDPASLWTSVGFKP